MSDPSLESQGIESDAPEQKSSFFTCLIQWFFCICVITLLVALLLPVTRGVNESARRSHCRNKLKQIGLALHNYHDAYGAFPPAYTVDADGKPLHSWRTLILPYFDSNLSDNINLTNKEIYEKIDYSKPWDDPANAEAYATNLVVFRCPSSDVPPGHTTY